jgi:hypothetical protein
MPIRVLGCPGEYCLPTILQPGLCVVRTLRRHVFQIVYSHIFTKGAVYALFSKWRANTSLRPQLGILSHYCRLKVSTTFFFFTFFEFCHVVCKAPIRCQCLGRCLRWVGSGHFFASIRAICVRRTCVPLWWHVHDISCEMAVS